MPKTPLTKDQVMAAIQLVEDPELGISIVDLGLIYNVEVTPENIVKIRMTLTFPGCPLGPQITKDIEDRLMEAGAEDVEVKIVWDPPWNQDMMIAAVKGYRAT